MSLEPYTLIAHTDEHITAIALHDLANRFSTTRCKQPHSLEWIEGYALRSILTIVDEALETFTNEVRQFYEEHEDILGISITSNYGGGNGDILELPF